jgi:zinc transport system ATP-binding protein
MRSGNDFIIEIENLSFEIDSTVILEKISLSVKKGEFLGIFGPNGGGKTTLLNLLLGFLKPSSGSIEIFGLPPHQARTQIGYVPQITRFDRKFPN